MTCQDIRELFSARVDDALTADERAQLDAHLAGCPECALEWQRFEGAIGLLRDIAPARAPAGFVDRVLAARPQPWYRRLGRGAFVPWSVKLPLDAAAIVLVAGLAIMLFQHSPELPTARAPETPVSVTAPIPTSSPPRRPLGDEAKERAVEAGREELSYLGKAAPPAGAPRPGGEARAKQGETVAGTVPHDGEADGARGADRPAAPPRAVAPAQKSAEVRSLADVSADVPARLAIVGDRDAAERAIRDLVARVGGQVVSRVDDANATVLRLVVPGDRWDEVRRGLGTLGTLRLDGHEPGAAGRLRLTLRLER